MTPVPLRAKPGRVGRAGAVILRPDRRVRSPRPLPRQVRVRCFCCLWVEGSAQWALRAERGAWGPHGEVGALRGRAERGRREEPPGSGQGKGQQARRASRTVGRTGGARMELRLGSRRRRACGESQSFPPPQSGDGPQRPSPERRRRRPRVSGK